MGRDIFENRIGSMLREAEAPVPEGAWEAIQQELASTPPSSGMGFSAGIAAGLILLTSLGTYSAFRPAENAPPVQVSELTKGNVSEPEVKALVEINVSQNELSKKIPQNENPVNAVQIAAETTPEAVSVPEPPSPDRKVAEIIPLPVGTNQIAVLPQPPMPVKAKKLEVDVHDNAVADEEDAITQEKAILRAAIQATNRTGYAPFKIDFSAHGNYEEVEWDFGPYGKSADETVRVTFDEPGHYTVSLFGFAGGDMVSDMVTIEVHEGSNLLVPDSFTPNGDGINDTFKAEGVNLETFQMTIVDARGKTVFETRNIEEAWVYQGPQVREMDGYFVVINARGIDGKDYRVHKRINIIF